MVYLSIMYQSIKSINQSIHPSVDPPIHPSTSFHISMAVLGLLQLDTDTSWVHSISGQDMTKPLLEAFRTFQGIRGATLAPL